MKHSTERDEKAYNILRLLAGYIALIKLNREYDSSYYSRVINKAIKEYGEQCYKDGVSRRETSNLRQTSKGNRRIRYL